VLEIRLQDGTVFLSGRLDASQAEKAKEVFATLNQSAVVDFSELDYISSAGISVILAAYKRLNDAGFKFKLVNMSARIRNVFQYAGLDKIFVIE
jgi:anti-sigma B factor antagonist/stage II sporulation protein AA (anti-sigma F factor antagonist)